MSYALAIHANAAAAPAFNGLFYATAATVIPVLFLALAVQGDALTDVLRGTARIFGRSLARYRALSPKSTWADLMQMLGFGGAALVGWTLAFITLVYGTIGEIDAIVSLSRHRAYGVPSYVVTATVTLTILAVTPPAVILARSVISAMKAAWAADKQPASQPPSPREPR
jgi:hypothetical protein